MPRSSPTPTSACCPGHAQYLATPIPDHGLPRPTRRRWSRSSTDSRAALPPGAASTCTAAPASAAPAWPIGCLLAENGHGGEAALEELNRLWQQSARARHVGIDPGDRRAERLRAHLAAAPRRRRPAARSPATLAAARGVRERFLGALLGLAVGDALARGDPVPPPGQFTPVGRHARRRSVRPAARRLERRHRHGAVPGREPARAGRLRCARPGRSATAAGSRRATCRPPASASASAPAPRGRWRVPSGAGSPSPAPTIRTRWTPSRSRASPAVVLFFFADREAALAQSGGGGAHHLPGTAGARRLPRPGRSRCTRPSRAPKAAILAAAEAARRAHRSPVARLGQEGRHRAGAGRRAGLSLTGLTISAMRCWPRPTSGAPPTWSRRVCGRAGRGALHLQVRSPAMWRNSLMKLPVARELRRPAARPRAGRARRLRRRPRAGGGVRGQQTARPAAVVSSTARSFPFA